MKQKIIYFLFFGLLVFVSFNKHSKDKAHSYHGVIWSDAAGYYVYNPIWFIYGNDASKFPQSIAFNCGDGFKTDSISNNVITKYPCGVAMMEAPFFLIAHALAKPMGFEANGFSKIYSYLLYISGVFYCFWGLYFISNFLKNYFNNLIAYLTPILFLASSNLFYYTIDAPGMSHIYSFFLFSLSLYISQKIIQKQKLKWFILLFVCFALIILIRPTNIIFTLVPFFYFINSKQDFLNRIKIFFQNKAYILIGILLSLMVITPQLLYWKNISGNYISYSYTNEGFSNWKNPVFFKGWFSINN